VKSLIMTGLVILGAAQAVQAAPACALQTFDGLKQAILGQNTIGGAVAVSPAEMYVGLNASQSTSNAAAGTGDDQYASRLWNRIGITAKTYIESDGNIEIAAQKILGATNRRQAITIYKRSNPQEAANPKANCGSGSCIDVSLEVIALHQVTGKSAQQVMDIISAEKLSTNGSAKVYYCEAGDGCSRKADLVTSNAKIRQSNGREAMKLNIPYTAREVASSIAGTIDNTSVYKVTTFDVCGHTAYLMSGVGIRDANSFANSSSDVLVVEANGKIMTVAVAQGVALKGSSVQGIFLSGLVGGIAKSTVVKGYNQESGLLGTQEQVDKNGFLN